MAKGRKKTLPGTRSQYQNYRDKSGMVNETVAVICKHIGAPATQVRANLTNRAKQLGFLGLSGFFKDAGDPKRSVKAKTLLSVKSTPTVITMAATVGDEVVINGVPYKKV